MEPFTSNPGFCSDCGSILPLLAESGGVTCYACSRKFNSEAFENTEVKYTIFFNSREVYEKNKQEEEKRAQEDTEGPIVEKKCPKCSNDKMSYATLQLRSADEGQTVFYTCTNCKYKETENS